MFRSCRCLRLRGFTIRFSNVCGVSYLVLALVYVIWGEKLYGVRRRKAVMSHYADRRFKPATGFLLFFLPVMFFVAMIITIVSLMK